MGPRYVQGLFLPLHRELQSLLHTLRPDQWELPTVAGSWRVRDVVGHLLDGGLRKLSAHRDRHDLQPARPFENFSQIVAFINDLNATGTAYWRRASTNVLVELLEVTGSALAALVMAVDPHDPAVFPVAWAGEERSENWMDTGREYTERWHHQMQIRDAVGRELLLEERWLQPLLDFSVRALPHAYQSVSAAEGTAVTLIVSPFSWTLIRDGQRWQLYSGSAVDPACVLSMSGDSAWRLLYNALSPGEAREKVVVQGPAELAEPFFRARSVMV